jgi:hypothetical protein
VILEGIVTTLAADGAMNVAPMGPHLAVPYRLDLGVRFELKPYQTSTTYANLTACPEGVLHVHDDVLLLARAAVGQVIPLPATRTAVKVRGQVLSDSCRAYEFVIAERDDSGPRVRLVAEIVHAHQLREFFGFNRAKHAVVEAAILATRTAFLPREQIMAEYERLAVLVQKTGGEREMEAFTFLQTYVQAEAGEKG